MEKTKELLDKPLVSVIIPVYNGEKYLRETLDRVLNSSYSNIEVIIVNDGSSDRSGLICREFRKRDGRVTLIEKKNGGIAAARNTGLYHASGEYIVFCDQDDLMHKDMISRMVNQVIKTDSDYIACSIGRSLGKRVWPKWVVENESFANRNSIVKKMIMPILFSPLYNQDFPIKRWDVWGCLFKKSIIEKYNLRFFSFALFEDDQIFTLNYLNHISRGESIKDILYIWRYNIESESNIKKYKNDHARNLIKMESYFKEFSDALCFDERIYANYIQNNFKRRIISIVYNEMLAANYSIRRRVNLCKKGCQEYNEYVDTILGRYYSQNVSGVLHKTKDMLEVFLKIIYIIIVHKFNHFPNKKLFTETLKEYGF